MKNILIKGLFLITVGTLVTSSVSAATCVNLTKTLTKGKESSEVFKLQQFLFDNGYLTIKPSGYFGQGTVAAVKKFQESNGFTQTGSTGPLTRVKMRDISCGDIIYDKAVPVTTKKS